MWSVCSREGRAGVVVCFSSTRLVSEDAGFFLEDITRRAFDFSWCLLPDV